MSVSLTDNAMLKIAWDNIERNLGTVINAEASEDELYDEAYTLAFDALVDADVTQATARAVAGRVAEKFVQP